MMKVGERVKTKSGHHKGLVGTIINVRESEFREGFVYGVQFDKPIIFGHDTTSYFGEMTLIDGNKKGKNGYCYNYTEDVLCYAEAPRVAYCKFKDNNLPYVFLNTIRDLKVGDTVVVDTKFGYAIATVSKLEADDNVVATKMVVCKIDTKAFEEKRDEHIRKVEEDRARAKRKEELLKEMKEVYASKCELSQFKKMAKNNKEMANLLKEYNKVEDGTWKPEKDMDLPF